MRETEVRKEWARLGTRLFVANHILDGTPIMFAGDREAFLAWRQEVASLLEVDPGNIFVVGSGSVGCSLNPRKHFSEFSQSSDIDIAVISTYFFDVAWRSIRLISQSTTRSEEQHKAVREHKKRHIFDGCIATEQFLSLLPFGDDWSRAALSISSFPPANGRKANFRIYRDVGSLRAYHERNVEDLLS